MGVQVTIHMKLIAHSAISTEGGNPFNSLVFIDTYHMQGKITEC